MFCLKSDNKLGSNFDHVPYVTLSTLLFMFHLISFSPHFTDVLFYFLQSTVYLIHFIYHSTSHSHLPCLFAFILHGHSTLLSVSLFSQSRPGNYWPTGLLNKVSILDRYSLLEADFQWLYYSLSLYIKQKVRHGLRRNVLVCSAADVYLLTYSTQVYVGKRQNYLYFSKTWIS